MLVPTSFTIDEHPFASRQKLHLGWNGAQGGGRSLQEGIFLGCVQPSQDRSAKPGPFPEGIPGCPQPSQDLVWGGPELATNTGGNRPQDQGAKGRREHRDFVSLYGNCKTTEGQEEWRRTHFRELEAGGDGGQLDQGGGRSCFWKQTSNHVSGPSTPPINT